uniref:Uncharacterized protein n=1 Tax=Mesocestoides corti TaxID=53468 RepID=A0A5K3EHZ3_MESCO
MSEENSWRTTLPPSSNTTSAEPAVVRPDTLNIGATAISMDLLTPQLLQFLQTCQPTAASTASTPDTKVLDNPWNVRCRPQSLLDCYWVSQFWALWRRGSGSQVIGGWLMRLLSSQHPPVPELMSSLVYF